MTRTIYLIRHAASTWSETIGDDIARILTEEGKLQAEAMGTVLAENNIKPDLMLASPATRAKTTAEIIAAAVGYAADQVEEDSTIYQATARKLLEVINAQDDRYTSLALVGHNPAISRIVAYLTQYSLENMPPAGMACLEFEQESWAFVSMATGTFKWFEAP
jgi:phosphohistidine phosphatase